MQQKQIYIAPNQNYVTIQTTQFDQSQIQTTTNQYIQSPIQTTNNDYTETIQANTTQQ